MLGRNAFGILTDEVIEFFDRLPVNVLPPTELFKILRSHREDWRLPPDVSVSLFRDLLLAHTGLKLIRLTSGYRSSIRRYVWGSASIYAIARSLVKRAYLSHGSAAALHGLTDKGPKDLYVNYEQPARPRVRGFLSQKRIHYIFNNSQRRSNRVYKYRDYTITVVMGRFTDRLGVVPLEVAAKEVLDVTSLERTLIDVTVRPGYAGGAFRVLEAYRKARDKMSVPALLEILKKLDYAYPYHQAIGFYMERAGYPETEWWRLRRLGLHHDFYLDYRLPSDREYDDNWRIFYPAGM